MALGGVTTSPPECLLIIIPTATAAATTRTPTIARIAVGGEDFFAAGTGAAFWSDGVGAFATAPVGFRLLPRVPAAGWRASTNAKQLSNLSCGSLASAFSRA